MDACRCAPLVPGILHSTGEKLWPKRVSDNLCEDAGVRTALSEERLAPGLRACVLGPRSMKGLHVDDEPAA